MEEFNLNYLYISIFIMILVGLGVYYTNVYYTNVNIVFPKIIHQSYKTTEITDPLWLECQKSWLHHNPTYEYKFWTDNDNEQLIKDKDPDFLNDYLSYNHFIKQADAARYYYMYHYGGIYGDLDFKCLKPFNKLLDIDYSNYDVILGIMGEDTEFIDSIPNALMISKPKSDFWLYVISIMKMRVNASKSPEYDTGPRLLTYCVNNYTGPSKIKILPKQYFYPINWNSQEGQSKRMNILNTKSIQEEFKDSYAVTYWSHSW